MNTATFGKTLAIAAACIAALSASAQEASAPRELAAMYNVCARVFEESGTCRENLNPETASGRDFKCGVDFCGWAALAPVAIPAEFGWLGKQAPSR